MKKYFKLIILITFLFSLTGCKEKEEVSVIEDNTANMISVYYQEGNQVVKANEKYQLKQPDSISASVEEVMAVIVPKLDAGMQYHTYMIDTDNNVSLDFFVIEDISKEKALLNKASITETLFQIQGINSIKIKLMDEDGNILEDGLYMPDSFYFYDLIP